MRTTTVWGLTLALGLGVLGAAGGQESPARPPRVRTIVKMGLESYKRGDYEKAAQFYLQAQMYQNELPPAEQQDLATLAKQNTVALEQRADGQGQLHKAEELVQQGNVLEAAALVRGLHLNQYLTPADRQKLGALHEKMRSANPGQAGHQPPGTFPGGMPRGDSKSLVSAARAALQRGDLATAESLAHQAERVHSGGLPSWLHPWSDSPSKVLRDVHSARSKQGPVMGRHPAEPLPAHPERKESAGPFAGLKRLFGGPKETPGNKKEPTKIYPRPVHPLPLPPPTEVTPAHHAPQLPSPENQGPSQPFQKRTTFGSPDTKEAPQKLHAQLVGPDPSPTGDPANPTPKGNPANKQPVGISPVTAGSNPGDIPSPEPAAQTRGRALQLIQQGYQALEANDLDTARQLAFQAKELRPDLTYHDQNPDRLLAEIQRRANSPAKIQGKPAPAPNSRSGAPAMEPAADARTLLRQARVHLQNNNLEEAERLGARAAAVPGSRWGLFEDSPERLRTDLQKTRLRRDREDADRLLVEARKLFQQGYYQDAKIKAWKAKQLHGPYSIWDLGDRPDRLLHEIERAESNRPKNQASPFLPAGKPGAQKPGPQTGKIKTQPSKSALQQAQALAQKQGPTGVVPAQHVQDNKPSLPPAIAQVKPTPAQAKARAISLLVAARDLQKKNQLIEARAKALEARQLEVIFGPDEDSPEMVLLSLAALCDRRIHTLMQQTGDKVVSHASDPKRFQQAEADLAEARRLAQAFGQDLGRIDQKAAWVKHMQARAGGNPGVAQVSDPPPVGVKPTMGTLPATPAEVEKVRRCEAAQEKLSKARLELKAGNTPLARRLAEEAFLSEEGSRDEAAQVLRSVDAEEFNQSLLASQRNAEAGVEAFKRRDFRQAGEIFKTVDLRLLNPQLRGLVREILASTEMQPAPVAQSVAKIPIGPAETPQGKVRVTDQQPSKAGANNTSAGLTDQYRALEEIQLQKLREKSLLAQRAAMELERNGDTAKAIETLKDFLENLGNCGLDPERAALLKRPVENRVQQLRTLQAQRALENEQRLLLGQHNEGARQKAVRKTQEEVAELMKQYQTFMKEGKYKEAALAAAKAKELDPDNVVSDVAIRTATIQDNQRKYNRTKAENENLFLEALDSKLGPYVDVSNPMKFDPTMAERIKNRKGNADGIWPQTQDPVEKAIERRLSQPINLIFKDMPLEKVISDLQRMSGINIVPDKKALEEASISLDQPMSLNVENVNLKSGLNLLLQQLRLTYVIKDQVLQITTPENAQGKLKRKVYPVADLVIPVENHPLPSVANIHDALARNMASQNGVGSYGATPYIPPFGLANGQPVSSYGSNMGSGFAQNYPGAGPQTSVTKSIPNDTLHDVLINLITSGIRQESWSYVGGPGTIQYYPLGMALIINQTQEVHEEVFNLLQSLRRLQDLEVAIEVKLVSVSEAFFEMMGVDFDINIRNTNSRVEPQLMSGVFAPPGQINRLPNNWMSGLTPAGTFTPDLGIPLRASSFDFSMPPFGGYPGTLGADGGLSLGLAFLNDIQVFLFMEAAQGDRRTNVMQAPKITVFNGQLANISITDFMFFLTNLNLVQAGNSAQLFFQPQNQALPIQGITLQVTPVVSADRRFVRLNLPMQMTNLASATVPLIPIQIPVPQLFEGPGSGSTISGQPVISQMFLQQPTFQTITINTTVNVPDGGTVLLGGMKTLSEARNEFGPPILSKIPYLSRLFKNVGYGRETQSLMIMVTPRIIINEEEEMIFTGELPPVPRP